MKSEDRRLLGIALQSIRLDTSSNLDFYPVLPIAKTIPINQKSPFGYKSLFKSGWSSPEEWGTWSDGHQSKIIIPYSKKQPYYGHPYVMLTLHFNTFSQGQKLTVNMMGKKLGSGEFKGESLFTIRCPLKEVHAKKLNAFTLELELPDAVSPHDVMKSEDRRLLGIALKSIRLETSEK